MVIIRPPTTEDESAIITLQRGIFGPGRFARTAYRVREGTPFASRFCRLAEQEGRLIAALRMTPIRIGGSQGALLLGPLAVAVEHANLGHGRRLIAESLAAARDAGLKLVLLVGDLAYYGRLGFAVAPTGRIVLPGPVDPARLLVKELVPGATAEFQGLVAADSDTRLWATP